MHSRPNIQAAEAHARKSALVAGGPTHTRMRRDDWRELCLSLNDFQNLARERLDKPLYEYLASGTDDEQTLYENTQAFKRYFLRPRMLRNVMGLDTTITLFGNRLALPVFISPAGLVAYQPVYPSPQRARPLPDWLNAPLPLGGSSSLLPGLRPVFSASACMLQVCIVSATQRGRWRPHGLQQLLGY